MNSDRLPAVILAVALIVSATIAYRTWREDEGRKFSLEDYHDLPGSFASVSEARSWASQSGAGGRVDQLELPGRDALVVFQHGSGVPVIKIGIYRRGLSRWALIAQPGVPGGHRGEFLRASAQGSLISVTGERSGQRSVLIDLE